MPMAFALHCCHHALAYGILLLCSLMTYSLLSGDSCVSHDTPDFKPSVLRCHLHRLTLRCLFCAQACSGHWQAGRQQCGALSLTGHPCILPPDATWSLHDGRSTSFEAPASSQVPRSRPASAASPHAQINGDSRHAVGAQEVEASTAEEARLGSASAAHKHSSGVLFWLADPSGLSRWLLCSADHHVCAGVYLCHSA